jgi:CBS domain-containing protein
MSEREELRWLEVRPVSVSAGDGSVTSQLVVYCPRQQKTLAVDACAECGRCQAWVFDPTERGSFVMCNPGDPQPKEAAPPAETGEEGPWAEAFKTPVHEVMTLGAHCVRSDLSGEALTALFLSKGISGAPVVDKSGRPIGMVSKTDLVRAAHEGRDEEVDRRSEHLRVDVDGVSVELGPGFHAAAIAATTVEELMTPLAFTIREDTPIGQASGLMAYEGVHRVPVVGEDGSVTGVVSATDILRWIAKQSGYAQ